MRVFIGHNLVRYGSLQLCVSRFGGYIAIPGFTSKSVKIRGINISYLDTNPNAKSQPVVAFIHGFTSQKLGFVPIIRALPKSWRVIAFDLPGHGESGFREDVKYCADEIGDTIHEVWCDCKLSSDWNCVKLISFM